MRRTALFGTLLVFAISLRLLADPRVTPPPAGPRVHTPQVFAMTNARIVVEAGKVIDKGTLVFRDGKIAAVGADVSPPADARVIDLAGKTIYPGFVDAYSELPADLSKTDPATYDKTGVAYWNPQVTPQIRAERIFKIDPKASESFRNVGFVARLIVPSRGIIKGSSAVVSTTDDDLSEALLRTGVAQHLMLTVPRGPNSAANSTDEDRDYPNSPMGAFALVRQAIYDAQWYAAAQAHSRSHANLPQPEKSDALEAVAQQIAGKTPFIIDTENELYALRADKIATEFNVPVIVRGSGREYRLLDEIVKTNHAIILPINFPRPPNVATPEAVLGTSLEELMHWDIAPTNPARLDQAGVNISITSHALRDRGLFLPNLRKAVARGLSKDAAIRALTTHPAKLLNVDHLLGSIEVGKLASVVVTDGDLFNEKTKVVQTWVDGKKFDIAPPVAPVDPRGKWSVTATSQPVTLNITGELAKLTGKVSGAQNLSPTTSPAATSPATAPATQPAETDLTGIQLSESQLVASFKADAVLGLKGIAQLSAVVEKDKLTGAILLPDGSRLPFIAEIKSPSTAPATTSATTVASTTSPATAVATTTTAPATTTASTTNAVNPPTTQPLYPSNYPLGDYGRYSLPEQSSVVITNVTLWTNTDQGILKNASVAIENGKIAAIYPTTAPATNPSTLVIDGTGKHLTPGIIDCHSHMATDSGVNESGQAITAEVRIGDYVDPADMTIYRQLAGGVTAANILHGSANAIGGQNQVVKLRWGSGPEPFKFENAFPGIKFALGENPKQSNWGDKMTTRYPQTRMGVEQIIRDEFNAAKDYRRLQQQFKEHPETTLPPRVDLELDAIAEILEGKRLIHCHSYRQDEILALIRLCDEFGIRIQTLQHILEGYKVADAMKKHGAMASTFSDWWAFKFEVYDAIPFNGEIMSKVGVNVSFNSDDAEMGRRLNSEAGKAVKYGGVSPEDALKFVTLNPAIQLRIDARVGSIAVGKDADLALWSGPPLSSLTRCEATWVDGRKQFDLKSDLETRARDKERRAALVQRVLASGEKPAGPDEDAGDRPQLWPDHDEFCGHGDEHEHQHDHGY